MNAGKVIGAVVRRCACAALWVICLGSAAGQAASYTSAPEAFAWINPATHTNVTWAQIAPTGGCENSGNDSVSPLINLGFTFIMAGAPYTQVRVVSNGRIQFVAAYCGGSGTATVSPRTYSLPIPSFFLSNALRIYGADLNPAAGGTVRYATEGTAPNRRFVVTWSNVPEWSAPGSFFNLQIILYEGSNDFVYQFGASNNTSGGKAQIGWEVFTSDYQLIEFTNIGSLANTAIRFSQTPFAEYRMEQCSWSAAPGQILDTSGSNNHATRIGNAQSTAGGRICRGGNIPLNSTTAAQDAIAAPFTPQIVGSNGAISFWYKSNEPWTGPGAQHRMLFDATTQNNRWFYLRKKNDGKLEFKLTDSSGNEFEVENPAALSLPAGTWVHIAVSWHLTPAANQSEARLYINGARVRTVTGTRAGALWPLGTLYFGDNRSAFVDGGGNTGQSANGILDQIRVWRHFPQDSTINSDYAFTHACTASCGGDHFALSHSGTGVTCQAENVTISAHDSAHNPATITAAAVLSTSTGRGDWSLVSGSGVLTPGAPNSGTATYAFSNESSVTLALKDTTAETVGININSGGVTETSGTATPAEDPALAFASSGFRVTDGALPASIASQRAGVSSATYYLQAIRTDTQTGACVGVFANGASVNVELASECNNPATCQPGQQVSITNNAITAAIAGNPNGAVTSYTARALLFGANSQAPFTLNYPDAGQIRLHARYNIPLGNGSPSGNYMTGASNPFVVKPAGFVLSGIKRTSDNFANPAAADANGAKFARAGEAFSVTVTAVNMQGAATPNYGRETTQESVSLTANLAPGLGLTNNPALSGSFGSFTGGIASGSAFRWDEAGIITLTPAVADGDYLGAGNVSGDQNGNPSGNVGRFYPDHFALSLATLTNRSDLSCPASTFTYLDEPLSVQFTLTAQSAAPLNLTTQNYAGTFAKLDPAISSALNFGAADGAAPTPLTARLGTATSSGIWSAGAATVAASLTLNRAAAADGPFNLFQLGIAPQDSDGVALNALDLDADNNAVNDRALIGSTIFRYGRLKLSNAHGSELLPLPLPLIAQYWNGSAFMTNGGDDCTQVPVPAAGSGLSFSPLPPQNQLDAGEVIAELNGATSGNGTFAAGSGGLRLRHPANPNQGPGAANYGYVDVSVNTPAWLQYKWSGGADSNPGARATFGVYRGASEFIYQRENY